MYGAAMSFAYHAYEAVHMMVSPVRGVSDAMHLAFKNPANPLTYTPVSYTHLDVYKRQIILRLLQQRSGFVQFETMFDPEMGAPGLVVHFLAMLELAREKLVEFTQTEAFQPIYVRVHQGGTELRQESA